MQTIIDAKPIKLVKSNLNPYITAAPNIPVTKEQELLEFQYKSEQSEVHFDPSCRVQEPKTLQYSSSTFVIELQPKPRLYCLTPTLTTPFSCKTAMYRDVCVSVGGMLHNTASIALEFFVQTIKYGATTKVSIALLCWIVLLLLFGL